MYQSTEPKQRIDTTILRMKQHQKTLLILTELDENYKILDLDVQKVAYQDQMTGVNRKAVPCPNCSQFFVIQVEISVNSDCLLSDSEGVVLAETDLANEEYVVTEMTSTVTEQLFPDDYIEVKEVTEDCDQVITPDQLDEDLNVHLTVKEEVLEDYQKPLVQDTDLDVVGEFVEETPDGSQVRSARIYKIKEFTSTQPEVNIQQRAVDLFECPDCHEKFKTKYSFRIHKNVHTEKYKCRICFAAHPKKERLMAHLRREHTKEEQEIHHAIKAREKEEESAANKGVEYYDDSTNSMQLIERPTERATSCTLCDTQFNTIEAYFTHVKKEHGTDNYICGICGKILKSRKTFKHHMIRAHTDKNDVTQLFHCKICDAKYLLQRDLNHHVKLKHTEGEKPRECPDCGDVFTNRRTLYSHRLVHSKEGVPRPHTCKVCGKSFSRLSSLKDHLITHTRERKFTCSICHQKYPRKSYLRIHMRIHTGDRPYSCNRPGCDVRFYDPASLRQHRLMHERKEAAECNVLKSESVKMVETSEVIYFYE